MAKKDKGTTSQKSNESKWYRVIFKVGILGVGSRSQGRAKPRLKSLVQTESRYEKDLLASSEFMAIRSALANLMADWGINEVPTDIDVLLLSEYKETELRPNQNCRVKVYTHAISLLPQAPYKEVEIG